MPCGGSGGTVKARVGDSRPAEAETLGAFQRRYWQAWDGGDLAGVGACLADDFQGLLAGPDGAPAFEVDRDGVLSLLRSSLRQASGQRVHWRRDAVVVLERGPDEAAAMMRVVCDYPDRPEWSNVELTLEAYRRGDDGRWLLARASSERLR